MVLVDSVAGTDEFRRLSAGDRALENALLAVIRSQPKTCAAAARRNAIRSGTQEFRECVGPGDPDFGQALNEARAQLAMQPTVWDTILPEVTNIDGSAARSVAGAPRSLGMLPLIALTAGVFPSLPGISYQEGLAIISARKNMHDELAALSSCGSRQTVRDAGHHIQLDRPAAVIDAIEAVLRAARSASCQTDR